MENEDYWAKRYEALAAGGQLNDEAFIKQLLTHYKGTQVKLEALLGYFYSRYAKNGQISYADAVKLLNKAELADFKMSLEEFRREAMAGGYDQVLEEIYLSSSVSRLQALQAQMDANILALANQSVGMVGGHLVNTYTDTYYRSVHQIQTGTGLATDFARYNEPLVREIINQPWQNGDFSTRIWENQFRLINQLEKVLAQGAITGESIDQMAKALAEKMAVSERNARRLVNTESAHAVSRATTQSYEDTGVVEYKFSATLDIITSEICRELDGKKFAVKDKTEGLNAPPMHINCRSHTVPYFADDSGLRVARDKNGKTIWVDKNLNYKEWHKQYVESDPEYQRKEQMYKNRHADKKQYEKYAETLKDTGMIKSLDEFRAMKYNNPRAWKALQEQYRLENARYKGYQYNKDGTIRATDDHKGERFSAPRAYKPFAVIETSSHYKSGYRQIDRSYYDENGIMFKQVHSGYHNNAKGHPFGAAGEHSNSYTWDENGKPLSRGAAELTKQEKRENKDIIQASHEGGGAK